MTASFQDERNFQDPMTNGTLPPSGRGDGFNSFHFLKETRKSPAITITTPLLVRNLASTVL